MMRLSTTSLTWLSLAALTLCLGGCTVGSDFQRPQAQLPATWNAPDTSTQAADAAWWQRFNDPLLDALVQRMAHDNLDLQVAASRLEQSLAAAGATDASAMPQVSAKGGYTRARNSANGLLDPSGNSGLANYNSWSSGLQADWELDLWGRVKRQREAASARVEVARETRHAALVSLSAALARDYIKLRQAQNAQQIARQNLALAQHSLRLTQVRLAEGVTTQLEVEQAATQVAEMQASLPPLQQREQELVNALSLLLAQPPGSLAAQLQAGQREVAIPGMTQPLALGLPSELAARRPDIRRAEAVLHAATADMGVAEGDFYPRITLSGNVGLQALQLSELGDWGSRGFAFGPALSLPLFDGGRLRAMLRLSGALQQQAALQYRQTVLLAWHEVDDALQAWHASTATSVHLSQALAHSRAAWERAQQQYALGTVDYLHVLNAQASLLHNQRALSDSSAAASLALVRLYQALGGGWQA